MEDYENTNAREWLNVEAKPRREASPSLLIDLDIPTNDAEAAWRQHERPVDTIEVPADLIWEDNQVDAIAAKYKTFIFSQHRRGDGKVIKFDIWGAKTDAKAAKQAIHDWIQREAPSKREKGTQKFMKTGSMIPKQRAMEEKRWALEVTRHRYRQFPPYGSVFGAIGTFHWPLSAYRPEEALGNSFEVLDPIRMDCESYIVFNKDSSAFQVMGDSDNVKQAVLRIRQVCFQVAARQAVSTRKYLIHSGEGEDIPSHVVLVPYKRPTDVAKTLSLREGRSPQGVRVTAAISGAQSKKSVRITKRCLLATIAKLRYYRGYLELRVRLGTFLVTQYRASANGQYETAEFQKMLQQSQFVGETTVELGPKSVEHRALRSLQSADHLMEPQNVMAQELSDVKPAYTAVFIITDPGGDYRLSITWHDPANSSPRSSAFEEFRRQWTRLDRKSGTVTALVDVSLIDLDSGSAWQFDLAASQAVDDSRLPSDLQRFADSIRLDIAAARQGHAEKPFVKYLPYAPLVSLQQRISYRYGLIKSDYTVELSHFQDRVFKRTSANLPTSVIYESRWSLEVYHNLWDTWFAGNAHLAVGAKADWEDHGWFPADDAWESAEGEDGFAQLVEKLDGIKKAVWPGR